MKSRFRKKHHDGSIKVGITHGDYNGISYEIIIKTFLDQRMLDICTPVIYGISKVASYHRKALGINDFSFNLIKKAEFANPKRPNIINCSEEEAKVELGKPSANAGRMAFAALEMAVNDLKNGKIDVLVTAPINKNSMKESGFEFPGHTEYLANRFEVEDHIMFMVSDVLKVGVATGHIALNEVSAQLSKEIILSKLGQMNNSLIKDFGIHKPKIAVMGLNPHAGDGGLFGEEEANVIVPAIKEAFDQGIYAFGPFAADGFFGTNQVDQFDAVLAMYHDQGLIPFKSLAMEEGINFTAGLPKVRTSPAHGTAFEIVGKNLASPDSLREAIYRAMDIFSERKVYEEASKDPLKSSNNQNGRNGKNKAS